MTRGAWLGALMVFVLGAGCGGPQPLAAFKDGKIRIGYSPGSLTTSPTPDGQYLLFLMLQDGGFSPCSALSSEVTVTVNGGDPMAVFSGGCGMKGSSSPGFSFELNAGDVPQDATFVISDGDDRIEVQVENLFAAYRLQPRKPGFDLNAQFQDGANPVTRGEVLIFDRTPSVRDASSFSARLSKEHVVGTSGDPRFEQTDHDVQPTLVGGELRVTVPGDIEDGRAELSIITAETPALRACEGVSSCEVEITYRIDTSITVQP